MLNVDVTKASWAIVKNDKVVVSHQGKSFSYVFKNPGNITIKSDFVSVSYTHLTLPTKA